MSENEPTFANFFALFEQPIAFHINQNELSERLRLLQKQFHPDILSDAQEKSSQQNSAVINHAYSILVNPDSRANYLLELADQYLNINDSIADLDFLDDAMDMRMTLDDAQHNSDLDTINTLKLKVEKRIDSHSTIFEKAYDSKDWVTAMDATQKLKFLVKLKKDMDMAIDNSHQQSDNDDDLYL